MALPPSPRSDSGDDGPNRDPRNDGPELLRKAQYGATESARQQAREEAICHYLGFATDITRRFRRHGVPDSDLSQVAALALIKAVDRFDVRRGTQFTAFAAPTIIGEIKRYFRDYTWALHMPRRLQETALAISAASERLAQQLGRSPMMADLAAELGLSEELVLEGLECGWTYRSVPIPTPLEGEDPPPEVADLPQGLDPRLEQVENWQALRPLLRRLSLRERQILRMRFVEEMTQTQIAHRLGISQMQVSRLLSTCLRRLRAGLLAED
jgi:RNA polymerase sigma-B factor